MELEALMNPFPGRHTGETLHGVLGNWENVGKNNQGARCHGPDTLVSNICLYLKISAVKNNNSLQNNPGGPSGRFQFSA